MQIRIRAAIAAIASSMLFLLAARAAPVEVLQALPAAALFVLSGVLLALLLRSGDARRSVEQRLSGVLESVPAGIVVFDAARRISHFNKHYVSIYGLDPARIRNGMDEAALRALREDAGLPVIGSQTRRSVEYDNGNGEYFVENWRLADGRYIAMSQLPLPDGGFVAIHQDVSEAKRNRKELLQSQQFLNAVIENVPTAIVVKEAGSFSYTMVNHAAEKIIGIDRSKVIGSTGEQIYGEYDSQRIRERDELAVASSEELEAAPEHVYHSPDGKMQIHRSRRCVIRNEKGTPTHLLTVLEDLTKQRKAEEKIRFLAMHDALTELYNRAWFNENLPLMLKDLNEDQHLAVVLLDLDRFKQVNDTCGHLAGDFLVRAVASRMRTHLGERDVAIRLGGDEFAVLIVLDNCLDQLEDQLQTLVTAIRQPIDFEGRAIEVGVSVGYSIAICGAVDRDILIGQADLALYESKASDKDKIRSFNLSMMKNRLRTKSLARHMREAIEFDNFDVHYQPIVDAQSHEILSMEALLRWNHPEYGMVRPDEFIPIAEETGLIVQIGERVLQKACCAASQWPEHVRISVNLSPLQFRDPALLSKVDNALEMSGIDPSRLELELTEAALLRNEDENIAILASLCKKNVRIAMDDFGTGYSSLNYLRRFPFDKIKIDKSYVDGLWRTGDSSGPILQAVLALAAELHLGTTAEGVEHEQQVTFLSAQGCSELQGYFFSKALPLNEASALFEKGAINKYRVA